MKTFRLNTSTKRNLKRVTGLEYDELVAMSAEEIDTYLQKRAGKRFSLKAKIGGFVSRGSVYLYLNRIIGDRQINKKIAII